MPQALEPSQRRDPSPRPWRRVHCALLEGSPLKVRVVDLSTGYELRVELDHFSLVAPCPDALTLCLEGQLETAIPTEAWVEFQHHSNPA